LFTLLSFKINHKGNVLYDCQLADAEKHIRLNPLSSIIIGENGSGKSYLLSQIADFFRYIEKLVRNDKKSHYKYEFASVEYLIDSDIYFIQKEKGKVFFEKNGVRTESASIILPSKVVAMSFMVNDKFSFSRFEEDGFYDYRGIRATSNASYTSTIKRMITNSLIASVADTGKLKAIRDTLAFLGMAETVEITYILMRKTLFKKAMPLNSIIHKIASIARRKQYFNEVELFKINENPEIVIQDIELLRKESILSDGKIRLTLNLSNEGSFINSALFDSLSRLERLELISNPDIEFFKKDNFSFGETSSGEKNIIFTIFNLIESIKENTLLLIDEPELSLHPTWQMKYINFIKQTINSRFDCHLVLASHSHFMISDLEPNSSSLTSIEQDNGQRLCEYIEHSTYAWSVENILYKVFHLRTMRNAQVEMDLYELSGLISKKSSDINRLKQLLRDLEKIVLDANDPLNIIINQARIYIGEKNDK